MGTCVVTKEDIVIALQQLGLRNGDLCMVHSSMKSMGYVDGGAQAIIDAFEEVLGNEGTLVMPTVSQQDFKNSYRTWHMNKPSDAGFLTEYFRRLPNVYRSDNPTHSAAARGKLAYELTCEHGAYGAHALCPYGEYSMSDSSPWMKLYRLGGKVVLLGVPMSKNTLKHTVETRLAEYYLSLAKDAEKAAELKAKLFCFEDFETEQFGPWFYFKVDDMADILRRKGILTEADCGNAHIFCVNAKTSCDAYFEMVKAEPEKWLHEKRTLDWIRECLNNTK